MTSPTDVTLTAYQEHADAYVAASPDAVSGPVAALLEELARHVAGGEVLEVGSGLGLEAQYLEQLGVTVCRSDATPAFVERLRRSVHQARVLDVRRDDLGGPFDAVLAHAVLLHLGRTEMKRALSACHAAVRPGGVLALTLKEGNGEAWSDAKLGTPRWFVYWRTAPLTTALQRAGWTVLRLDQVQGRLEPWLHVLCRRGLS